MTLDPYFDKPSQPRRPLVSAGAVAWICLTVMACAFLWVAHVDPKTAKDLAIGAIIALGALLLYLKM